MNKISSLLLATRWMGSRGDGCGVISCRRRLISSSTNRKKSETTVNDVNSCREVNQFGIALLPDSLRTRLFSASKSRPSSAFLKKAKDELKKCRLDISKQTGSASLSDSISDIEIPPLHGDVVSHFQYIANEQVVMMKKI
jgi:hypothetical protein